MSRMPKVTVTDPEGVAWTVRRWWFTAVPWQSGIEFLDAIIFLIVLPFMLAWPFWLATIWLGARWSIVIERDGTKVAEERVRGWRRSGERIQQIARAVEVGSHNFAVS
jgi:hypothetical protein